ncbi:AraC family transcriptional regulator [Fulvivirga sedimenti]|uniref:AraC family transcriptional regulator n=1 Tax=Fulvivirga sedimenti TaxID=2879465 RepID=A0A9X1HVF4_9BACT|nr:AraC family transcriptional regulator [Fulvivirga sedimenti]MCA6078386.1 AraC family transcriptional regulator [Fulvivirga sedimenti]
MKTVKPLLEKIDPGFGNSVLIRQYADPCRNKSPLWHVHPELELVYVNGGTGKRHIGNQVSYYQNGDLIFLGSNLPHFGFTDRLTGNKSETVIQMRQEFLGEAFFDVPEMHSIRKLLDRAQQGIVFHGKTKRRVGAKMEKLNSKEPFERIISLLKIMQDLATTKEYSLLNSERITLEIEPQDNKRMNQIFAHVRENFQNSIPLPEIADQVSMTVPAFCRYFKKISGKTFTQFVNEYRLVHAVKLLSEQPISITEICYRSGFNNFSHFNKQFREFTGKSPSAYRNELRKVVS